MPAVSVIIPSYGKPSFLRNAIRSVLGQSFQDFELIVVDDNNPETEARSLTEAIIAEFDDERLVYVKHPHNRNGAAARNTGLKIARGEYISFLDSDDEYYPERLTKCIAALSAASPSVAGVYTGCEFRLRGKTYNEFVNVRSGRFLTETLACTFMLCSGSNIFVRRSVIDELKGFDEAFLRHQDYEFMVRLFRKYSLIALPELLVIKNNENTNVPYINKVIAIKRQYLATFSDDIASLPKAEQSYIFHSNYVNVAETAMRQRKIITALTYYKKAARSSAPTLREVFRACALLALSIIRPVKR